MIQVRKSAERGHANHGWLESRHTFSFAGYHDPAFMGFQDLRVINEDRVAPGRGFDTHSHRDMEIVSYVLDGAIEHRDNMGNGSVIVPGDVQLMRAGTGVTHSEYNHSKSEPVHFLQIWILPDAEDLEPAYEQRHFPEADRRNRLRVVASQDGRDGSVRIHQDVALYASLLDGDDRVRHPLAPGRHAWVQVARGRVRCNGTVLEQGDGAAVSGEAFVELAADGPGEVLLFDLV